MLNLSVMFDSRPTAVTIEDLPEGISRIVLRDNLREETQTTEYMTGESSAGGESAPQTYWVADVACMKVPTAERLTYEEYKENFAEHFASASEWTDEVEVDTIETLRAELNDKQAQIDMLSECILEMSAEVYSV